jgi:hypothetical protein
MCAGRCHPDLRNRLFSPSAAIDTCRLELSRCQQRRLPDQPQHRARQVRPTVFFPGKTIRSSADQITDRPKQRVAKDTAWSIVSVPDFAARSRVD